MDVREKLVELLKTSACPSTFICDPTCKYYGFEDCFPERFADYLIAHGVTVQEWIDKAPTIDAVPVVRCKDCKYFKTRLCENEDNYDDWFCADGERKYEVSE